MDAIPIRDLPRPLEADPIFRVRPLDVNELPAYAHLVRHHSWGEDYPVDPFDEISTAAVTIGLFRGGKIVGGCYLHRAASPDSFQDGPIWFAGAVIHPFYRGAGGLRLLYAAALRHLQESGYQAVAACTDNSLMVGFFNRHQWKLVRTTTDESGSPADVFLLSLAVTRHPCRDGVSSQT